MSKQAPCKSCAKKQREIERLRHQLEVWVKAVRELQDEILALEEAETPAFLEVKS